MTIEGLADEKKGMEFILHYAMQVKKKRLAYRKRG